VKENEPEDSQVKFKAALKKKNEISKIQSSGGHTIGNSRVKASSGRTLKLFRRKSG
jgi:hypothetical protein